MRIAALLLPFLAVTAPSQDGTESPQLKVERGMTVELNFDPESSAPRLTIRARDVSAEALTRLIAQRLRVPNVVGFEAIDRAPRVTAYLVDRPAHDALRWMLGSVGIAVRLESNAISVVEDVGPYPDAEVLLRKAGARYFDSLKRFPDYPLADRAEMARAEIHERLGPEEWGAAVLGYDRLIEAFPRSPLIPEATLRSARVYGLMNQWQQAALRFEELAARPQDHPFHAVARRELAQALCRVGESESERAPAIDAGEKAIYVLDALDVAYPTQDPEERYSRLLVRARGHALAGRGLRALQSLDAATRYSRAGVSDPQVLELRARSLARVGEHGAASTAWLACAEELTGTAREDAYVEAAKAALTSGEEVAVLMIERRAEAEGFGRRLAAQGAEARARLGLPVLGGSGLGATANLARGEAHVAARRWGAAVESMRPAFDQRVQLSPPERVRLGQAYAKALHRTGRQVEAIDVLRTLVAGLDKESQRRPLYVLASELYEDREHPRLDLAIEALNGRL